MNPEETSRAQARAEMADRFLQLAGLNSLVADAMVTADYRHPVSQTIIATLRKNAEAFTSFARDINKLNHDLDEDALSP